MKATIFLFGLLGLAADSPAATPRPIKLMFGAETQSAPRTKFLDFAYVTPSARLDGKQPWGWTQSRNVSGWVFHNDRLCSAPMDGLLEHSVTCWDGAFSVRVPNGPAAVHLWIGDSHLGIRRTMAS
jgi:hypothetical protein